MKRLLTILTIVACLIGCGDGIDRYEKVKFGNVTEVIPYNDKNQIHGTVKSYNANNVLMSEQTFVNGIANGWHKTYIYKVTDYEVFYKDGK
ncbi:MULTISPECIES: hypothetical protein [unclassified Campylobacter]|uniref:hypothetical protein n=1 Tax=unclassified Campylobacter TaxID=2593542 RepID=UPI003D32D137